MNADQKRSIRLNVLLKSFLKNGDERELVLRIKQIGVTNATAKDYFHTVRAMALKMKTRAQLK